MKLIHIILTGLFLMVFSCLNVFSEETPGTNTKTNSLGMTFKYILPGEFMMGSPEDEPGRLAHEKLHKVRLTNGFYMQITELTQGQWKAVMEKNPSYSKECGDNCPVEMVSWNDIQLFLTEMNKRGEGAFRLPTEAEWEYACRAGSETIYSSGNSPEKLKQYAWHDLEEKKHPVGQLKPNAWGLYDMHGNVMEWCQDLYCAYPDGTITNPKGCSRGLRRIIRGGSSGSSAEFCRSATRYWEVPKVRYRDTGFRLVWLPLQPK